MGHSLLFNRASIFQVMEYQKELLKTRLRKLTERDLEGDEEELVSSLVDEYGINVPVLKESDLYASKREVQVDISGDPRRFFVTGGPHYIPGTEVTIHVPFKGDAAMFDVQPTSFNLNPPFGQVSGSELLLVYTITGDSPPLKPRYEAAMRDINTYLKNQCPSANQLKEELRRMATAGVADRKRQHETHRNALSDLGIPVRETPQTPRPSYTVAAKAVPKRAEEVWHVFVSHASEDKDEIARPLYEELKRRGLKVWFDEFTLKLGDSLRQSIDRGLARSRYGVVILSKHFFEKHWPAQELNGLATREVQGTKVILPVWHKVTHGDVANFSPTLADRLAAKTEDGIEAVVKSILEVVKAD